MEQQQMLQGETSERAVLACMMQNIEYADEALLELNGADFLSGDCRRIFSAMECLNISGQPIDLVTVGGMFSGDMLIKITEIYAGDYLTTNFKAYLSEVKQASNYRKFITSMRKCLQLAEEGNSDCFSLAQSALDTANAVDSNEVKLIGASVPDAIAELGEVKKGLSTGYPRLDGYIKGLVQGNMIVVAGRPSMGKSAFATNIAVNVAIRGGVVAMFSLEMKNKEIAQRILLGVSRTSERQLLAGNQAATDRLYSAMDTVSRMKMYSHDSGALNASKLRTICKKIYKREGHLDLVVIDYIGLMQTTVRKNGSRAQEIGELSHAMKQLAQELDCTVIAVAQLNREAEKRADHIPMVSDLRESGDIEQDADIILFPFRPSVYDDDISPSQAELIIAKNRNGQVGKVNLYWQGESFLFDNPATEEENEYERKRYGNERRKQRSDSSDYLN